MFKIDSCYYDTGWEMKDLVTNRHIDISEVNLTNRGNRGQSSGMKITI